MANLHEDTVDLREYITILKARKWSVILVTVMVLGSALAFSFAQTPIYGATARLLVAAPGENPAATNPLTYIVTEAQLLSSEPVAALVLEDLDLATSTTALLRTLAVEDVPDASVLNVSFVSPDPEVARDVANSFASNYISYKQQRALEETRRLQQDIQVDIDELTARLGRISDQVQEADGAQDSALKSFLEDERTTLLAQLGVLQQQLSAVAPDETLPPVGEVIQPAQLPERPVAPNHIKNGLLAAFIGLGLGIGVAFLRERLEDRFRSRSDIETALGLPVLAMIPWVGRRSKRRKSSPTKELIAISGPNTLAAEAYRSLRTNLQFVMMQRSLKSLLVTSAGSAEGKTVTSSNLAVAMAQAGKRVILVSADMRRPTLEEHFGLERTQGVSNWLMGGGEERELAHLLVDPRIRNLRILPCGVIPANSAELLTSINVTRMIRALEANADLVIVDAPPVLAVADAKVISSVVGGVLMVLHASSTHRSAVMRAKQEIERVGGETIGTVLNAWDEAAAPDYRHYVRDYQDGSRSTGARHSSDRPDSETRSDRRPKRRMRTGSKP